MKRSGWTLSSAALMGGLVGASTTVLLLLMIRPHGLESWTSFADGWADSLGGNFWALAQTLASLFGGVMTLIAAGLAWSAVQRQINSQLIVQAKERNDELRAARALLPVALSELVGNAQECADTLLEAEVDLKADSTKAKLAKSTAIDPFVVQVLTDCIRSADEISAEWFATIVRVHQICTARTIGATAPVMLVPEHARVSHALDWTILRCLAEQCFKYSRGEIAALPETFDPAQLQHSPASRVWHGRLSSELKRRIVEYREDMGAGRPQDWEPWNH